MGPRGNYFVNPEVIITTPTLVSTQALVATQFIYQVLFGYMYADFFASYNATSAGGNYTIPMPSAYKINLAHMASNQSAFSNASAMTVGSGQWQDAGVSFKQLHVMYLNESAFVVNENPGLLQGTSMGTADSVKLNIRVPVVPR